MKSVSFKIWLYYFFIFYFDYHALVNKAMTSNSVRIKPSFTQGL